MEPGAGARLRIFGVTQVRRRRPPSCPPSLRRPAGTKPRTSVRPRRPSAPVQGGNSVLLHVRAFLPYLYVAAPRGFTNADCLDFANDLNVRRPLLAAPAGVPAGRLTSARSPTPGVSCTRTELGRRAVRPVRPLGQGPAQAVALGLPGRRPDTVPQDHAGRPKICEQGPRPV